MTGREEARAKEGKYKAEGHSITFHKLIFCMKSLNGLPKLTRPFPDGGEAVIKDFPTSKFSLSEACLANGLFASSRAQ